MPIRALLTRSVACGYAAVVVLCVLTRGVQGVSGTPALVAGPGSGLLLCAEAIRFVCRLWRVLCADQSTADSICCMCIAFCSSRFFCQGDTALHMALRNDKAPDVSRLLVRFGADTSLRNKYGETAMDLGGPVIRAVIAPSLLARWFSSTESL